LLTTIVSRQTGNVKWGFGKFEKLSRMIKETAKQKPAKAGMERSEMTLSVHCYTVNGEEL
jgi:hypothetical protein